MQYPELNIGEFARRHPSNVRLEYDGAEEEYFVIVNVEPEEDGYPVSIGARPNSIEDIEEIFKTHFADYASREGITVYGNDEDAIRSTAGRDTWARFEGPTLQEKERNYLEIISKPTPKAREDIMNLEDPDYGKLLEMEREDRNRTGVKLYIKEKMEDERGDERYSPRGWAIDIWPVIKDLDDNYESAVKEISAATLDVISNAESEGEVGASRRGFLQDITEDVRLDKSPIQVEVEEERGSEESVKENDIDYDELVSGTISHSKEKIEEREDELDKEDWEALLEAEKRGEDRETFKPYLEEHLEEKEEK